MISPILVRELRRDGDVVKHFKTQTLVDKVCSERTLREVRKLLESVGTEGTGAGFFRDTTLYTVAAKTGTAQYADDKIGYRDGYYIGSMVAYFPAHNPRYTVLTTIHTKRQAGKSYYGGPLSGPVVKKVVTYLYNREHDWDLSPENSGENTIPGESKAATSPRSAASPTNSRPAPRSKTAKAGERYGSTPSRTSRSRRSHRTTKRCPTS